MGVMAGYRSGQLNTISIVTGGFIIVGLIIGIRLLWDGIFRRKNLYSWENRMPTFVTIGSFVSVSGRQLR